MSIRWSAFLSWYRPLSDADATISRVFRTTTRLSREGRALALAEAACKDALAVPRNAPLSVLEHLAVTGVATESAGRPAPDAIVALVTSVLGGTSLVDALGSTDDECAETLRAVLTDILELDAVGDVEYACLQEAIIHANWGWHGTLAERVPAFVDLLLDGMGPENFALSLLAVAVLRAFAVVMAVPTASERSALVCALLRPSPVSREDGVRAFVTSMCNGACFYELAELAATTWHQDLLATFVAIAPERAVATLREALSSIDPASASVMGQA